MLTKKKSKRSLHILEDNASGVQVGDIKICLKYNRSLVLDVDFMTLTILKLEFSFIFLEFVIYLRASSQNCGKPSI